MKAKIVIAALTFNITPLAFGQAVEAGAGNGEGTKPEIITIIGAQPGIDENNKVTSYPAAILGDKPQGNGGSTAKVPTTKEEKAGKNQDSKDRLEAAKLLFSEWQKTLDKIRKVLSFEFRYESGEEFFFEGEDEKGNRVTIRKGGKTTISVGNKDSKLIQRSLENGMIKGETLVIPKDDKLTIIYGYWEDEARTKFATPRVQNVFTFYYDNEAEFNAVLNSL